jgi:hypothetical protein
VGRLEIYLNKFSPWVGYTNWNEIPQEKYKRILIYLGGPIASALVGFIFLILVAMTDNTLLKIFLGSFLLGSIVQFLSTIIPMTYKHGPYKGMKSDGYYAIQVIKEINY